MSIFISGEPSTQKWSNGGRAKVSMWKHYEDFFQSASKDSAAVEWYFLDKIWFTTAYRLVAVEKRFFSFRTLIIHTNNIVCRYIVNGGILVLSFFNTKSQNDLMCRSTIKNYIVTQGQLK